jgi:hypothetical protein
MMARKSLPKSTRLANIASKRPKTARRILGKETLKLGTKAFNKMFPQLGTLMNGKSTAGSLSSNSNDLSAQMYNSSFSEILENQNKQNDILNQILQQIKDSNNFSGNNGGGNDNSPFSGNYKPRPRNTSTIDGPRIPDVPKVPPVEAPDRVPPVPDAPNKAPQSVDSTARAPTVTEAPARVPTVNTPTVDARMPNATSTTASSPPITPEAATRIAQSPVLSSTPPPITPEAATRIAQTTTLEQLRIVQSNEFDRLQNVQREAFQNIVPGPEGNQRVQTIQRQTVEDINQLTRQVTERSNEIQRQAIQRATPSTDTTAPPARIIDAETRNTARTAANAPEASARTRMSVLSEPNNESRPRIPPTFNAVPPPPTPAATPAPPAAPVDVSRTPIPGPDASRVPPAGTAETRTSDTSTQPRSFVANAGDVIQQAQKGSLGAARLGAGAGFLTGLATEHKTGQSATSTAIAGASTAAQTVVLSQAAEQTIKRIVRDKTTGIVLRKIPLAGLLAGIWFSGERVRQGDWIGAGLELTSGVAGTLGGVTFGAGTAASVAIDIGLLTRDIYKILYDKFPEDETDAAIRDANIVAIGTSVTEAFNDFISSAPAPQNPEFNEETREKLKDIYDAAQGESEEAQMLRSLIGEDVIAGIARLLGQRIEGEGLQAKAAREGMARVLARIRPLVTHGSAPSARMLEIPPPSPPPSETPSTQNKDDSDGSGDSGEEGGSGSDATLKEETPEIPDATAITPEKLETRNKSITSEKNKENNNLDVDTINKNSMMSLTLKEFERINFEARLIKFESTGLQSKLTETDTVQNRSSTGGSFASISNISGSARNIAAGATGNITTGDGRATNGSAARALEFFQSKGWSLAQASGIVANLDIETGGTFNPAAVGDGGRAYGIAQWHPDRQAHFQSWAGRGIRGSTFEQQLEFVQFELTEGREKRAGNRIRQTTTPQDAAAITDQFYERSDGTARARRIRRAITLAGNAAQDATQTNQASNTGSSSESSQAATQAPSTGGGNGTALSQASTGAQADTHNHGSSNGGQNSAAPVEPSPSTGADLAQAGTDMVAGDQRQVLNPQGMMNNNTPQSPVQQTESPQSNPREQMTSNEIPLRNRLESTFSYRS